MSGYRIQINGDTSGNIDWQIFFAGDNKEKSNDKQTSQISLIVDKFVDSLKDIHNVTS